MRIRGSPRSTSTSCMNPGKSADALDKYSTSGSKPGDAAA